MIVDYEAVVLELEEYAASKTSHGQRSLLDAIRESKLRHRVPEGLAEKALRLYGSDLSRALQERPDSTSAEDEPSGSAP